MFKLKWHHNVLFFTLLTWSLANGQTTVIVQKVPANTPVGDGIYMSGDFENWTGGQGAYKLTPFKEGFLIDLPVVEQDIAFKFTRGNWNTVEVDRDGSSIPNRLLSLTKKNDTIRLEISAWGDLTPKSSTAAQNVQLLSDAFDMVLLPGKRSIWIYLPESYEHTTKDYPVLYMHDGQNLFDKSTSFTGEWEVDETLNKLAASGGLELIVVGIENGGEERIDEYVPYKINNYNSKMQGHAYLRFIDEILKPYVDDHYRTIPDREHTGIMGSSLGGLISFYAAMEFNGTFGLAGVFSPSFEIVHKSIPKNDLVNPISNTRVYLMCGDEESEEMAIEMAQMVQEMKGSGFDPDHIFSEIVEGGRHNEALWRNEFGKAVSWLFKQD